jgi:hypothetical protein
MAGAGPRAVAALLDQDGEELGGALLGDGGRVEQAADRQEVLVDLREVAVDLCEVAVELGEARAHLGEPVVDPLLEPVDPALQPVEPGGRLDTEGVDRLPGSRRPSRRCRPDRGHWRQRGGEPPAAAATSSTRASTRASRASISCGCDTHRTVAGHPPPRTVREN